MSDTEKIDPRYLSPTPTLDSNHPAVQAFASRAVGDSKDPVTKAVRLFYAVRDGIWYDPYAPFYRPEHYRASFVIQRGRSFCIPKAALLCTLCRCCGIAARLGFATVKNHLTTRQLLEYLGTNLFVFHGFTEIFLNGRWIKVTPAFNKELCERHQVPPLEFDGFNDCLFQAYTASKQKYMEYIEYHGSYDDVPVARILEAWREVYGAKRVDQWIRRLKEEFQPMFEKEEVWHD